VPIIFGTASVSGTFIYAGPIIQSTTEQGGKSGPEQKLYNYNQTIAVGLCESVIDLDDAIGNILRIWENGALVYDIRPQLQANTQTGQIAETDDEFANRQIVSSNYRLTFTLYIGNETQLPDPTLESIEGVGNVGGYRGLAYVVYPNRLLTVAQGLRHPNFQFECATAGVGECTTEPLVQNEVIYPWNSPGPGVFDPRNPLNTMDYAYVGLEGGGTGPFRTSLEAALADGPTYNPTPPGHAAGYDQLFGWSPSGGSGPFSPYVDPSFWNGTAFPAYQDLQQVIMYYNRIKPITTNFGILRLADENAWILANPDGYWIGAQGPDGFTLHGVWVQTPDGDRVDVTSIGDDGIVVNRFPSAPPNPCYLLPPAPIEGYCISETGQYIQTSGWTLDTTHTFIVMQSTAISGGTHGGTIVRYPLNPCLISTDPANTEAFWTAAYEAAVAAGKMAPGLTYETPGSGDPSRNYPTPQSFAYTIDVTTCEGTGSQVSVAEIISKICQRAGLMSIDVTDMEEIFVDGYQISTLCSGASIIQPLRSIAYYDAVESGELLRFQSRGKAIAATLTTDDIGAYDVSQGGAAPPASVQISRTMDTELPRQVRVHYIATQRDYQDSEQDSQFRLTTLAVDDTDVSLPYALHDTQALNAANILWATQWAQRNNYTIAVDQSWSALECGDAIAIPVENFYKRVLLTKETNANGVLRTFTAVDDASASYISNAIAPPNPFKPPIIPVIYPTRFELLDIPALQDSDADPGFYIAAQRDVTGAGNTWTGCSIYKSIDGGATFTAQFALTVEAALGKLYAPVAASQYFDFDDETEIIVETDSAAFTFESRSDDAVMAGANAAAMGMDGRWEIIQFCNAELISPLRWKLTRLLRGRRGTEHVLGTSEAGDTFVLVSGGDLNRIPLNTAEIGASRIYKAVSIGNEYLTGVDQTFIGHAVALLPFSPVDAIAERLTDGDILISWVRRDRFGRTLMSGVDIPLSDPPLTFQIDIIDTASPHGVLRTLTTTMINVYYTHADQVADFGSGALMSFRVAIYQMSPTIGRGTPLITTLEVST